MATNRVAHLQVDILTLHQSTNVALPEGIDKDNPLAPYVHKTFILHILQDHLANLNRALQHTLTPEQRVVAVAESERIAAAIRFVAAYPQEVLMLNICFCPEGHEGCV